MDKKDSDNLPDVYQATKVTDEVAKVLKTTLMPVATTVTILTASPIFSLLGAVASAFIAFQASSGLSYRLDRIEEFVHQTDDAVKNLDLSQPLALKRTFLQTHFLNPKSLKLNLGSANP